MKFFSLFVTRSLTFRTVIVLALAIFLSSLFTARPSTAQSGLYVSTFAGLGFSAGFSDGQGVTARFNAPLGMTIDKDDNLIVADFRNHRIRKIDPEGRVTTIAGVGGGFLNGPVSLAKFFGPAGVALDKDGNIIVADYGNNRIRMISTTGTVTTLAGSGQYGSLNGAGGTARFANPSSVAVDNDGNVYVLDSGTNLVRKIDRFRYVSTVAGSYNDFADGQGSAAAFSFTGAAPQATFDLQGNLVIADFFNSRIRQVTPDGNVTTIAGGGSLKDGPALQASFFFATGIARDHNGDMIIADWHNAQIRKLDMKAKAVSTIAGNGTEDNVDGPALQASFVRPGAAAVDSKGNIFVSDYF
ncbi:MAG TPA: hypothetical protein PKD31_25870, partial [Blastocatellia bacterium]|nr:hypothetical protein [Blastocatellia bacterium]